MSDAPRRLVLLLAVFVVTAGVLFALRGGDGRYGLFDLLRGRPLPKSGPNTHKAEPFTLPERPVLSPEEIPGFAKLSAESALITARVIPAVVSIAAARTVRDPTGGAATRRRLGAGFIVTPQGHVMTANHVVYGVEAVVVRLADDRLLPVELVGVSPRTDIAVLKIITPEKSETFPALSFIEDSETVRQGEFAFSFGNPYGLRGSSDFGIISAKERRFSDGSADLFQTSTRMLPGHSGGPLVNVSGQVIGINTAIYREDQRAPLWSAVGMAIVANDARDVLLAILKRGKPIYGHLGVHVEIPAVYSHLRAFNDSLKYPVQVNSVEPGSAAEKAGLRTGDVVTEFAGEPVNNFREFKRLVRQRVAGEEVSLAVRRNGEEMLLKAVMAELDPQAMFARMEGWTEEKAATFIRRSLGADVTNLSAAHKKRLGLPAAAGGVVVSDVLPRTPAHGRLRKGDIIQICNGVPFQNARQLAKLLEERPDSNVDLLVVRPSNGARSNLLIEIQAVDLDGEEEEEPATAPVPA